MANGTKGLEVMEDGLFDYEGFATVGGAINLSIQPIQYVQINAGVAVDYSQNHFITFTKIGKDRGTFNTTTGKLDSDQKDGLVMDNVLEERNPTYSKALDATGSRIKRTESLNLDWSVSLTLMY